MTHVDRPAGPVERSASALYQWACERLYHEFAWSYDVVAAAVSLGNWDRWRRSGLDFVHGPTVLELGFGTGALLPLLAARYPSVIGIELSAAMVAIAQTNWRRQQLRPPAVRATALSLPLGDGCVDTAVATFPAPYLLAGETLEEIRRVLKPGGRLVAVGLWVDRPAGTATAWIRLPLFYGSPRPATLARIERAVADAGLDPALFSRPVAGAAVGMLVAQKGGDRHAG